MRHKYDTEGIVLARTSLGEANTLLTIITPSIGLVRARAQGLRKPGAKLASALATLAESELVLIQGKEGWRIAGAVLTESWLRRIESPESRVRIARVSGLLLRLVAGEAQDKELFPTVKGFIEALATLPVELQDPAELLVVLRILAALGLDAGDIPAGASVFAPEALAVVADRRSEYVSRINNGITVSGL